MLLRLVSFHKHKSLQTKVMSRDWTVLHAKQASQKFYLDRCTKKTLSDILLADRQTGRQIRYDTIVEFNVDSKAEYTA